MKFWLIAPWVPAEELMQLAIMAEEYGFTGIMGADHGFVPKHMEASYLYSEDGKPPISGDMPYPDVWTSLAAMAAVTKSIKLSTAVYVLPLRHPIEIAKATGTIARISNNRLVLGAGAGWMKEEFDVYGVDFHSRGRRMDETIDLLRKLWQGGYVAHEGEFFKFPELAIEPAPTRPIPIYIGGESEPAFQRAARSCQGWIGAGNKIAEVAPILERLQHYRREAGTLEQEFETVIAIEELHETERLKELEEQGLTSVVFGYARNYDASLGEKRTQMERFANVIMSRFTS